MFPTDYLQSLYITVIKDIYVEQTVCPMLLKTEQKLIDWYVSFLFLQEIYFNQGTSVTTID